MRRLFFLLMATLACACSSFDPDKTELVVHCYPSDLDSSQAVLLDTVLVVDLGDSLNPLNPFNHPGDSCELTVVWEILREREPWLKGSFPVEAIGHEPYAGFRKAKVLDFMNSRSELAEVARGTGVQVDAWLHYKDDGSECLRMSGRFIKGGGDRNRIPGLAGGILFQNHATQEAFSLEFPASYSSNEAEQRVGRNSTNYLEKIEAAPEHQKRLALGSMDKKCVVRMNPMLSDEVAIARTRFWAWELENEVGSVLTQHDARHRFGLWVYDLLHAERIPDPSIAMDSMVFGIDVVAESYLDSLGLN